ncbi:MAG: hypothetical protein Q8K68_10590 [Nitrospirota bacterium]|nr:hypothetical protein [Nitrospirota bacterium]
MTLETLQRWAERYAQKLGLTEMPKVGWRKDCTAGPADGYTPKGTHCHIGPDNRGLVCIHPSSLKGKRGWKWLIAHEVCHLKVKSHRSPYFWKWMGTLGFASERVSAQVAGVQRHRHSWGVPVFSCSTNQPLRRCTVCGQLQDGKVTWGKVSAKP